MQEIALKTGIQKKIRRLNISTALLVMVICSLIMFFPTAKADNPDASWAGDVYSGGESDTEYDTNNTDVLPYEMCKVIVSGCCGPAIKILTDDTDSMYRFYHSIIGGEQFEGEFTALNGLYNGFKFFGFFGIVIISFVKLFQELDKGKDADECVYKALIDIAIIGAFFLNLDTIIYYIVQFGDALLQIFKNRLGFTEEDTAEQAEQAKAFLQAAYGNYNTTSSNPLEIIGNAVAGVIDKFFVLFKLLLPWIAALICNVIVQWQVMETIFEIAVRRAMAPMAVVDIYSEGLRSPGFVYLKKLLVCFVRLGLIMIILFIMQGVIKVIVHPGNVGAGSFFKFVAQDIALNLTVVGLVMKAPTYASDILGA